MPDGLNRVQVLGNLGADPELRVTPGGQAVLKLRVAATESYVDRNNARQERTEWVRCVVWGRRAEALGKILHKGERVFLEGRLQTSKYEKNGEARYSTEVVVDKLILLGGRGERPAASPSRSAAAADDFDEPSGGGNASADDLDTPF